MAGDNGSTLEGVAKSVLWGTPETHEERGERLYREAKDASDRKDFVAFYPAWTALLRHHRIPLDFFGRRTPNDNEETH